MSDVPSIVSQLFDALGVKRVVYVDDRFGITRERIASLCRDLTNAQIVSTQVFTGLELTDDEGVREQRLAKAIEELQDLSLQAAFDSIEAVTGIGNAEQDRIAAQQFSEILDASADVKLLSRAEWQAQSKDLIAEVTTTPTLFVFDDDFRLEGGNSDDGRRLIVSLHAELQDYKYAYALLTHNATTDPSEDELEKAIAQQYPDIQDFVVVIAKTRLTGEDRNRFVFRLKSTLLFRLFRRLKNKLKEATIAAQEKAAGKIDSLGVDAFERIIHRSSNEEGAWSPETLVRIFGVMHEREIRSRLRGDESLHASISEIDPLCTIETGGISKEVKTLAEELQRAETYDTDAELNVLHLPVDCGDIFRSDEGDQYVVVAQACDLVVRSDGRRRPDTRDERQLVVLLKVNSRQKSKKPPNFKGNEFELSHYVDDEEKVWFSEVNQTVHVPAWILDLAVLNPAGACTIGAEEAALPLLTLPWRKRLPILKERASQVVALSDAAAIDADEKRQELLRSLLRLPLSTTFSVKIDPLIRQPGETWLLQVGLRRVLRVRERYAAALLGHYANYLSRPGQPHDLTHFG